MSSPPPVWERSRREKFALEHGDIITPIPSHQKAQAAAVHVIYTEGRGSPHAQ